MAFLFKILSILVVNFAIFYGVPYFYFYDIISTCQVESAARMEDKTVLITGANSGVGLASAVELAKRGARVLMACRDASRCEAAAKHVREAAELDSKSQTVSTLILDLANFASIRSAAQRVLTEEARLDVLMNNAGLITDRFELTVDGLEITWQVNHVGHFLLTKLLLPLLKRSQPSRVVTVSSDWHYETDIFWDDVSMKKNYSFFSAYRQSKLANVLFASELAWRLKNSGYQITSNSLCPGFVETSITRHFPSWTAFIINVGGKFLAKTPEQGAQTQILLAVDYMLSTVTGDYFAFCKRKLPSLEAHRLGNAERLWRLTEQQLGEKFMFDSIV